MSGLPASDIPTKNIIPIMIYSLDVIVEKSFSILAHSTTQRRPFNEQISYLPIIAARCHGPFAVKLIFQGAKRKCTSLATLTLPPAFVTSLPQLTPASDETVQTWL